ncbi:hypothetical protein BG000_009122 [Podila horticola]|nr:hypothetical protein BG000_009122 [Podila horticola]
MISALFELPRIAETIARAFTCEDLLSCILVNRAWHTTWIRILWSDIITYGTHRTERGGRVYDFYFHSPDGQKSLTKHAHHIRAVTCRFQRDLLALTCTGVSNLVEINFIVQEQVRNPSERHRSAVVETGLSDLIQLVAQNPNLRAVSIENLGLLTADKPAEDLLALVTFLETRPGITCFYVGGNATLDEGRLDLMRTILSLRLDRIDGKTVQSLVLRDRQELMRYRRGPPSIMGVEPLLKRYSGLRRLGTGMLTPLLVDHVMELLPDTNTDIQELDVSYVEEQALSTYLTDPRVQLSSLSVKTILRNKDNCYRFLLTDVFLEPHHFFHTALVRLDLHGIPTVMPQVLQLLGGSPNMKYLDAGHVHLTSEEPDMCAPWVCTGLTGLRMQIHLFNVFFSSSKMDYFEQLRMIQDKAETMAGSFMAQLGSLTELRELELRFNDPTECDSTPFLALNVEAENGLRQLEKLDRLEKLVISGVLHRVGDREVEWMAAHWPRLRSIELPVFDGVNNPGLADPQGCEVFLPDYERCFSRLKVKIPIEVYHCRYCRNLKCDCTESSDI